MDNTQLQQNIAKYYLKLPTDLQKTFSDMEWIPVLKNMSDKYHLDENQMGILSTETTLILLGIIHVNEYYETLSNELKIDSILFEKIREDINTSLLNDLSIKLENQYESNIQSLVEEKYGEREKTNERFANLPKEVQLAINESNYQVTLYSIAEKFQLNIEQMGILEEVTTKVMLGIIHPDKYQDELSSRLGILQEESVNIIKDVNEKILKTISEILKKHWSENNTTEDRVPIPPYKKDAPENKPMVEPQPNILEDKLTKPVVSETSTSIHKTEIKKEGIDNSHDPYREII